MSGNSKAVNDPFDTTVGYSVASIQVNEKLVAKDRGEELSPVVVQSTVPNSIFQQKQFFEPRVEGFDRLAAPGVESFALGRFTKPGS